MANILNGFIYFFLLIFLVIKESDAFDPVIIVHGGAGDISEEAVQRKFIGMKKALEKGYRSLIDTKSSLNAVEAAVRVMEDDDSFNAGYGSVLTENGEVEMDVSIMNGDSLRAGCMTVVQDIANPISLARLLMEKSKYVFLAGNATKKFAIEQGVEILPSGALISNRTRQAFENYKILLNSNETSTNSAYEIDWLIRNNISTQTEPGTVGAVAIDRYGNISVATSTGGIMCKPSGRVGDSPILGSGSYADNLIGGVSATGDGEYLQRFNIASQILERIKYKNMTAQEATKEALEEMKVRPGGKGGAITIDWRGQVGFHFISNQMAWGYRQGNTIHYGANKGDMYEENVD